MAKFLVDEDFNNRIVRGVRRRNETIDIVRVHEVGLLGRADPEILDWAASKDRIVLTHDAATMIAFGLKRISEGSAFPGMIVISQYASIGRVIEDIAKIAENELSDLSGQIAYLPFRH